MFKKLALTASCVCCFALSVADSSFISLGKTTMNDIMDSVGQKPMLLSPANIPGYIEVYLKSNPSHGNAVVSPSITKCFKSTKTNTIDAIAVEFQFDILRQLISDLNSKYPRTYFRNKLSGTSEIEYINGKNLIRIIQAGEHTLLIHGTIKWFNAYDQSRGQVEEIQELRRANRNQYKIQQQDPSFEKVERPRHVGDPKPYHQPKEIKMYEPPRHVGDPKPLHHQKDKKHKDFKRGHHGHRHPYTAFRSPFMEFDHFFNFDNLDKIFEEFDNDEFFNIKMPKIDRPIKSHMKKTDDGKEYVKSYSFSQNYSKNGDIEKLKRNDNGDVTEILKTPEEVTVTHNGETQSMSPQEFKNFDIRSGKIKNSMEPTAQTVNFSVNTPETESENNPNVLVIEANLEPTSESPENTEKTASFFDERIGSNLDEQTNCPLCPIFSGEGSNLKLADSNPIIKHCPPPCDNEPLPSDFSENSEDDNESLLYGRE